MKEGNGNSGWRRQFLDCDEWGRLDPRQQSSEGLGKGPELWQGVRKGGVLESGLQLPPTSSRTLGKSFGLSGPQYFSSVKWGDDTHLTRSEWLQGISAHSRAQQMEASTVLQRPASTGMWEQNRNSIMSLGGRSKVIHLDIRVRRQLPTQ